MTRHTRDEDRTDRGSVLILTLLVVVMLGSTVVALATYATTSLRASTNARSANERRSAADGALKVAIDEIRAGTAPCLYDAASVDLSDVVPVIDGLVPTVTCDSLTGPLTASQNWAAVVTGANVASGSDATDTDSGPTTIDGPMWLPDLSAAGLSQINTTVHLAGPVVHPGSCGTPIVPSAVAPKITFGQPLVDRPVCSTTGWQSQPSLNDPPLRGDFDTLPPGVEDSAGSCTVFHPGVYDNDSLSSTYPDLPVVTDDAYFQSGDYVFIANNNTNADLYVGAGARLIAGKDSTITPSNLSGWGCASDPEYLNDLDGGATLYLSGRARLFVDGANVEILPRLQTGGNDSMVSVQALCTIATWCDGPGAFAPSAHTSNPLPPGGNNRSIVRVTSGSSVRVHGLVYAPTGMTFLEASSTVDLLGGIVTGRLQTDADLTIFRAGFLAPDPADLLISATVTDGTQSTSMEATVTYDPMEPTATRVTVTGWRLCDPTGC